MDKFGLALRTVVFFLFPVPFLLSFAVDRSDGWPAYVAYIAAGVLVVAAIAMAWAGMRGESE